MRIGIVCVPLRWFLAIFPGGFTLFHQSAQAFLGILQAVQFVQEDIHGLFQALAQSHAHSSEDGGLGHGQDRAGVCRDAVCQFVDGVLQFAFRYQPIDQPKFQRALGGNWRSGEN